jgi:hypothetical protein
MFEKCGRLASVSVPIDRYTGRNKGFLLFLMLDLHFWHLKKEEMQRMPKKSMIPIQSRGEDCVLIGMLDVIKRTL